MVASSFMESAIKMDKPICLIENKVEGERTTLKVNPEAIDILSKIRQPVVVVSIVGMYRTGKSYLMNRLAGSQKGFSLGSTVQSETKGIWMWCVPHPTLKDHVLVLLDTEGLGDVEKGDRKNDSMIFALAVLLSSALVYNSMGTINQDALDTLNLVGEITELIKVKTGDSQNEEAHYSTYFPTFIWAVRDLTLDLELDGKPITADEYLENSLKLKTPEKSSKNKKYNALRKRIRTYFRKRSGFVFNLPTDSINQVKKLEQLPDDQLNEAFIIQSNCFCDYIFKNAEVKRVGITVPVNGQRLAELAKLYTEALNSSKVVRLEEAVISLAEKENKIAVQEAKKFYEDNMKKIVLPTETDQQFHHLSGQHENGAKKIFLEKCFKDKDQKSFDKHIEIIKRMKKEFSRMNEKKSREKCEALIKKHSKAFEKELAEGKFLTTGGHGKYKQALQVVEQEYNREEGKGVKAEEVLHEYMTAKHADEIVIIQADHALSQKQKEEEVEKERKQIEEMKKKIEKLEEERENQKLTEEISSLQSTVQQLIKTLEEERRLMDEKLEQVIKDKEREWKLLMDQKLEEQAKKFEEQINVLRSEKKGLFAQIGEMIDSAISLISGFWPKIVKELNST